jgi:UDPglucose 6-dehydrogenase
MKKSISVGIIGVGKLGLAYALCFEQAGFHVVASSYNSDYVTQLNNKQIDSTEPGIVQLLKQAQNIEFTTDNQYVIDCCQTIYVMVATPSTDQGDYDVSAVDQIAQDFANHGSVDGKVFIIGSTVNPGTTDRIQDQLRDQGVSVVYCPTFVAQGSVLQDIRDPHTVSIGTDSEQIYNHCHDIFTGILTASAPVYQMSPLTAEILKLAGNCRATMEISFVNMIGQILITQGLAHDLDTANQYLSFMKKNTKWKFGFGFGGPCYPRDNSAMVHFANKNHMSYDLGKLIDDFNRQHVDFLASYLLQCNSDSLPFYFTYLSYKPGVSLFEESHQLKVCKKLLATGATIQIEKSEFLPNSVIADLKDQYGHQVTLVDPVDHDCGIFKIKF